MKQPYLVSGRVRIQRYMVDEPERINPTHIVWAEDGSAAEDAFRDFYNAKTVEYDVYYLVGELTVFEPIGTP